MQMQQGTLVRSTDLPWHRCKHSMLLPPVSILRGCASEAALHALCCPWCSQGGGKMPECRNVYDAGHGLRGQSWRGFLVALCTEGHTAWDCELTSHPLVLWAMYATHMLLKQFLCSMCYR